MRKFACLFLAFLFVLPILVACENDITDESSSLNEPSSEIDFTVKIGNKNFYIDCINCEPFEDSVVLYNNDYRLGDSYSPVIGVENPDRTIVSIRALMIDGAYEFDIVAKNNDTKNGVIPYNGFALSIPNDMLDGVRLNVGQIVTVEGLENIASNFERTDLATISPDYLTSVAMRRVNLVDPVFDFSEDNIYYITDKFNSREIEVENVVVTAKISSNYSCKIISIDSKKKIEPANKGEVMFVFTGKDNVAFAEYYFKNAERVTVSDLDRCNSYSDKPAFVMKSGVVELDKNNFNIPEINNEGIYVFNGEFSSSVTPETDLKRKDVVVVNDYVVYIGNENERTLIPEGNGFVITFAGNDAVSDINEFEIGKTVETCYIDYFSIPDKYVEINGRYFGFDFQNGVRAPEGTSVVYTSEYGKTTGTNIYGSEIVVEDGKVIGVNIGKGDSQIPQNGFVLSIHKDSEYIEYVKKVKVGDSALMGFGGDVYGINVLEITGVNSVRNENALILYKDRATTQTNPYGYEIAIDKNGITVQDGYDGNMEIPKGGLVLSGHGTAKTALEEAFAIGQNVILDSKKNKVILIKTPKQRLESAKYNYSYVSDKLDSAKKAFLNLDYNSISSQISLIDKEIAEADEAFKSFDFERALEKADAVISICEKLKYSFNESHGVENRAVWYRANEKSDEQVRATVLKMKELNINAVYLETWYEGYCIGSKVEVSGISKHPNCDNYDVLDGFVRICHEYGIEVHAWVHNFFVGYYYKDGRNYYNKSFDAYKDKYLIDKNGNDYYYYRANNNYFFFLNPYDRECRDLILNVYKQLINNYDLDGLHLDYVRMPELNYGKDDFGYNQDIIDAFKDETGIKKDPRTLEKNTDDYKKWVEFRCNIITSFVGEVYDMARMNKPDLWLSAATYPDLDMAKNDIFQDVRSFINNGYLDEVFSMSYGVDNGSVLPSVKSYNIVTENKVFYSAGIAAFLETTENNFGLQLDEVIKRGADGVSIFSLASITPNSYYKSIVEGAFRAPSVQVNKLSLTASSQMKYIKEKADNLSSVYQVLDAEDIAFIKLQCDEIIKLSESFDPNAATTAQKIAWCKDTLSHIASAKSEILSRCGENNETESIISEFEALEYWLEISALRLNKKL